MLHLIPTPLAENAIHTLPNYLHTIIKEIKIWCVEDLRTARRFLKSIDKQIDIDALQFILVNEHTQANEQLLIALFAAQNTIGLMSDAGCPAVADPGSRVVEIAHQCHVKVVPHIGPSSILLALMASGMNGQSFMFHGYLPIKNPDRTKAIVKLEQDSIARNCTQIFIEAPYRNHQMLQDILQVAHSNTRLCIAIDVTAEAEQIICCSIKEWKSKTVDMHKKPALFLMLG
jgi:16S rRNA (cytidine1402-2'-O)-methyltransferase